MKRRSLVHLLPLWLAPLLPAGAATAAQAADEEAAGAAVWAGAGVFWANAEPAANSASAAKERKIMQTSETRVDYRRE